MSYHQIDYIVQHWVVKHMLTLYPSHQDYEVRSVDIVDQRGRKYQIWIDPPDQKGNLEVHAWDYKRKRKDYTASIDDLGNCLEEAYSAVLLWMQTN